MLLIGRLQTTEVYYLPVPQVGSPNPRVSRAAPASQRLLAPRCGQQNASPEGCSAGCYVHLSPCYRNASHVGFGFRLLRHELFSTGSIRNDLFPTTAAFWGPGGQDLSIVSLGPTIPAIAVTAMSSNLIPPDDGDLPCTARSAAPQAVSVATHLAELLWSRFRGCDRQARDWAGAAQALGAVQGFPALS